MFNLVPFENNKSLSDYFDRFEKSFFSEFPATLPHMRTDILDKGDHYELHAELPGFEKQDIKLDVDGDVLMIKAEHQEESEETQAEFVRRERKYGSYARRFDISNIASDSISASYENGILHVKLPKKAPENPLSKTIEIA